jgi:hypothetical protein
LRYRRLKLVFSPAEYKLVAAITPAECFLAADMPGGKAATTVFTSGEY